MTLIADGLLIAAALTAAVYCHVLAGRLKRLKRLDGGVGQAIAAMSVQVDEMRAALKAARATSGEATRTLAERTARAEMAAGRLELLLASLHDRDGSAPVDLAAARRRAGVGLDVRAGEGGGTGLAPKGFGGRSSAYAVAAAASRPDPDPDPEGAAEADPVEQAFDPTPEENTDEAIGSPEAAGSEAPPPPGRRLFRIERSAAAEASAPTAHGDDEPSAHGQLSRNQDEAERQASALKAKLEALARETSE